MERSQQDIFKDLSNIISNSSMSEQEKVNALSRVRDMSNRKINMIITGGTGSGKSSTINALFDCEKAKVGTTANPETMEITRYELNNLVLWDSPGLGDGREADNEHAKKIIDLLAKKDDEGKALIDMVLVILDGATRDLGTSFELINNVIIPNLGDCASERVLVAINKCDAAMSGRNWNYAENRPEEKLVNFLDDKVESVRRRIKESTGVDVETIYYSAGYKEDDGSDQSRPYNLSKLLYYIIEHTPVKKRIAYANNLSQDQEVWKDNDTLMDYHKSIARTLFDSVIEGISEGAEIGGEIGDIFGPVGKAVGSVAGATIGAVKGFVKSVYRRLFGW